MTVGQYKRLERLWFVYGNNGPKHTWGNHKFIQELMERGVDDRAFFAKGWLRLLWHKPLTIECEIAVDAILNSEEPVATMPHGCKKSPSGGRPIRKPLSDEELGDRIMRGHVMTYTPQQIIDWQAFETGPPKRTA